MLLCVGVMTDDLIQVVFKSKPSVRLVSWLSLCNHHTICTRRSGITLTQGWHHALRQTLALKLKQTCRSATHDFTSSRSAYTERNWVDEIEPHFYTLFFPCLQFKSISSRLVRDKRAKSRHLRQVTFCEQVRAQIYMQSQQRFVLRLRPPAVGVVIAARLNN